MLPKGINHTFLGSILRREREAGAFTQEQLGAKFSPPISFQQVQKYEYGTNEISLAKFVQWCRACGSSPMSVLAEAMAMKSKTKGDRP